MSSSKRTSKLSDTDEMFALAAYDAARDAELQVGGNVAVVFHLSQQRGVWLAQSRLVSAGEALDGKHLIRTESSFPNSRALTMGSFLFAQMNIVAQMATEMKAYRLRERNERT